MSSPLHAALGESDHELTLELVRRACEVNLPETEQIDFKRVLPLPSGQPRDEAEQRVRVLELAKDIAAMSNSRGGQLIYGVRDEDNRAAELVGVHDLTDGEMARRIRQVAFNFVYPPVQIECVALSDGGGLQVLVATVPESSEAPHLVRPRRDGGNDGWFVAPYRVGADTVNMVEKQLESAYRERFEAGRRRRQLLLDAHAELVERRVPQADEMTGTVVAVLQPTQPPQHPVSGRSLDLVAREIVQSASRLAQQLAGGQVLNTTALATVMLDQASSPRRSLRRFVFNASSPPKSEVASDVRPAQVSVEVHDAGTIGLTWRRGAVFLYAPDGQVSPPLPSIGEHDMDMVAVTLVSLMVAANDVLATPADYLARIAVVPARELFLIPEGGWTRKSLETVPPPPVVEAEVRLSGGPDERAADILALAQDLSNMIERSHTPFERLWSRPSGSQTAHPIYDAAQRLFGGEPDHPVTGQKLR